MLRKRVLGTAVLAALLSVPAGFAQTLDQTIGGCAAAPLRTIQATPANYKLLLSGLQPGDRLLLAAGTYTQNLRLQNLNGQPGRCIVIEGPASGSPALFLGSDAWNTVSFKNVSYLAVRNLELDGLKKAGDGVKAEVDSTYAHHVTLERLKLRNYDPSDQRVGISTKSPAWNWVIRYNTIQGAGTGLYLGSPDGSAEFANSLIEHNLVSNTLGYGLQIKHQTQRRTALGIPASGTTVIRHNVFSKETGSAAGTLARPNVLLGHWPLSGAGSTDLYQVYGNLFYQNPTESLFQAEGNVALHDNLFVNRNGPAVRVQPHNSVPRRIEIFHNTIVASGRGIQLWGADTAYPQRLTANAVFAGSPEISGGLQSGNLIGTYADAGTRLNAPYAPLGSLDLYPRSGALQSTALTPAGVTDLLEWDRDFNGLASLATFRGAYSGDGANPGWAPALAIKP